MSGATIIDVTFVDADGGQPFLKLKLPLRQLPATFTGGTMLSLGKDDWGVVEAVPSNLEDIVKAGTLRLVLRKVQYVDPTTLLLTLPTVADVVPEAVTAEDASAATFRLHEDDWLQLELVPSEVVGLAQADLEAVRVVLANERQGMGFKRLHLRRGLPTPFAAHELQLAPLRTLFGAERAVAWRSGAKVLQDCFAFDLPSGAVLYGQQRAGRIAALGLTARDEAAVARMGGLTLIDWCAGQVG